MPGHARRPRRRLHVNVTLDGVQDQVRVLRFISEVKAQKLAARLRQASNLGLITAGFHLAIGNRLGRIFSGQAPARLHVVHAAMRPGQSPALALQNLPPIATQTFVAKLQAWLVQAFAEFIKAQAPRVIAATEDAADGITLRFHARASARPERAGAGDGGARRRRQRDRRGDLQRRRADRAGRSVRGAPLWLTCTQALGAQTERQVAHWVLAASRLDLDELASREAWGHLERYLGVSLRRHLTGVIDRLKAQGRVLAALQREARSVTARAEVRRRLLEFERQYLRTERTLDFFADAINCRTNPQVAALLRACDTLAHRSMAQLLDAIGKTTPPAVTYLGEGPRRLDPEGAPASVGRRRDLPGRGDQVGAPQPVAAHRLDPRSRAPGSSHRAVGTTNSPRRLPRVCNARVRAPTLPTSGPAGRRRSRPTRSSFAHTGFASVAALHDVLDGDPAAGVSPRAGRSAPDQLPARAAGRADVPLFLRRGAVGHARAVVDRHAPAGRRAARDARDRAGLAAAAGRSGAAGDRHADARVPGGARCARSSCPNA